MRFGLRHRNGCTQKDQRKAFELFKGERWNTYNNLLALSDPADLTPIQRVAYLAYWYESEVINGGHFQYFHNQPQFNQLEVIDEALYSLDAQDHAAVLTRAWSHFLNFEFDTPERVEEYVAMEADVDLSEFDRAFWSVGEDVIHRLEEYLDKYEEEFLEWVL